MIIYNDDKNSFQKCEYCGETTNDFYEVYYMDEDFDGNPFEKCEIVCKECDDSENWVEKITGYSSYE